MGSDGKDLEALVAFVEETLVPQGFSVKTNKRVYSDEASKLQNSMWRLRENSAAPLYDG
jgi:hypothetical protein